MRSLGAVLVVVTACAVALGASTARAAECTGVVTACINDDTLWPHAGPARFIAVGSTETTAEGQLGFGLVTSYLSRPVVLRLPAPGASVGGSEAFAVDDLVNGTFLWSFGVTRSLELDLAVPLTFGQGGTGLAPVTGGPGLKDTAVRDARFGFTYALHAPARRAPAPEAGAPAAPGRGDGWGLAARLEVSAPIGDADQFAGERAGVFAPSAAADLRAGRLFAGAELGARVRPDAELLDARIGTQLVASLGVGYDILAGERLSATLEAWALPTFAEQQDVSLVAGKYQTVPNGKRVTPAEWQLSVRSAPLRSGGLSVQLGGGGGVPLSGDLPITAPRFRFTLALRWAGQ